LNISSPVSLNSTVSLEDFAISASVSNVTLSQGVTITLNGQVISNGFNPTTGKVSALFKLNPGENTIIITVTNDCGTVTQTLTVQYTPIVAPPVPPAPPVEEEKITICHTPPGNSGNPQTIEIPLSAWPAHQTHGDVLGACVETPTPLAPPVEEEKITICHYPPGNVGNPQTLEIPLSAWPAHQAHGDVLGSCVEVPNENGNNQNGNGNSGGNSENENTEEQNENNGNSNSENGNNGSNGSGNGGNNGSGNGNGGNKQVEKPTTKPTVKPEVTPPVKTETKEEKPLDPPKPATPVTPKGKGGGKP
jgi:hypothetical protein